MKQLATYQDYDSNDITSDGYDWTLYADGHVSAESRSRWQNSIDGRRYVSAPGLIEVSKITEDKDNDAEAALVAWVADHRQSGQHIHGDLGWSVTRAGSRVR